MSERIDDLTGRVVRLEEDVSDLKVSTARISTQIESLKDYNEGQFKIINASLLAIDGRVSPPKRAQESKAKQIFSDVMTPQTIAIILAILASALGAPMVSQSIIHSQISPAIGTHVPVVDKSEKIDDKKDEE